MKKYTYIFVLILFLSCEEETKNYKPLSSGRINSVSVITDKVTWESKVGNEIRNIFASEFKGLPQIEESFNLSYIPYEAFTGFVVPVFFSAKTHGSWLSVAFCLPLYM